MKHKILIFLLVICSSALFLNAQRINVATYNIRNVNAGDVKRGNGWEQRCPVVCQLIQFHDFDIVGTQEVVRCQLDDMLRVMPEYAFIGVGRDDGKDKGEFVPILYKKDRFRLLQSGNFWLSTVTDVPNKGWDAAYPRICTWGKFKMKEKGKSFWLFNLHMDHRGVVARSESAKLVLEQIKTMCGKDPVILMGDFNVDQHNEAYLLLNTSGSMRDVYDLADVRYGILTDSYRSNVNKDSVIRSSNFPQEVSFNSSQARLPSDHFPVLTTLEFVRK